MSENIRIGEAGASAKHVLIYICMYHAQDLVAISPTSVVASYQMRTMAEQAVFALNGLTMSSGNQIAISLFFPHNDPQVVFFVLKLQL